MNPSTQYFRIQVSDEDTEVSPFEPDPETEVVDEQNSQPLSDSQFKASILLLNINTVPSLSHICAFFGIRALLIWP